MPCSCVCCVLCAGGCALDPSELVAKGALHCAFALHSPEALHKCDCAVMTICQAPWSTDVVRGPHSVYGQK